MTTSLVCEAFLLSAVQEINGTITLGGNALADAEGLWEEHLRAPDHH